MSEYVSINTSVTDILSAANDLVLKGSDLESSMTSLIAAISDNEGTPIWGNDEFSEKFLTNYHGDHAASESIKNLGTGSNSLGTGGQTIGNSVATSMFSYTDNDTASASDIDGTAV